VASFTSRPSYPRGKSPRYSLVVPKIRSGRCGKEKKSFPCPCRESKPSLPALSQVRKPSCGVVTEVLSALGIDVHFLSYKGSDFLEAPSSLWGCIRRYRSHVLHQHRDFCAGHLYACSFHSCCNWAHKVKGEIFLTKENQVSERCYCYRKRYFMIYASYSVLLA
jgi:hypothetical protein